MNRYIMALFLFSHPVYADNMCSINGNIFTSAYEHPKLVEFTDVELSCDESDLSVIQSKLNEYHPIYKKVDLNGDGKCEYFMHDKNGSGSGGDLYFIYSFIANKFTNIGNYQSWGVIPAERHDDWYQLSSTDLSGGAYIVSIYTFENGRYKPATESFLCNMETQEWEFENPENKKMSAKSAGIDIYEKAMEYYRKKDYKEALRCFKMLTDANSNNWKAWNNQALTLYKLGDYKSSSDISFSVRYNKQNTSTRSQGNASFNMAMVAEKRGELNNSIASYKSALEWYENANSIEPNKTRENAILRMKEKIKVFEEKHKTPVPESN